jgi:hypothetical protein
MASNELIEKYEKCMGTVNVHLMQTIKLNKMLADSLNLMRNGELLYNFDLLLDSIADELQDWSASLTCVTCRLSEITDMYEEMEL